MSNVQFGGYFSRIPVGDTAGKISEDDLTEAARRLTVLVPDATAEIYYSSPLRQDAFGDGEYEQGTYVHPLGSIEADASVSSEDGLADAVFMEMLRRKQIDPGWERELEPDTFSPISKESREKARLLLDA